MISGSLYVCPNSGINSTAFGTPDNREQVLTAYPNLLYFTGDQILCFHQIDNFVEKADKKEGQGLPLDRNVLCSGEDIFRPAIGESMRELLLAVDAGREPIHSGRDNLQTMAIVDAAYLSASSGAQVEIADLWPNSRM